MAKNPQTAPKPAASSTTTAPTTTSTATDQASQEAQRAEGERLAEEEAKRREAAEAAAKEQREDLASGGDGTAAVQTANEAGAATHSITDPKAAPVDYSRETMRRTPNRLLPESELSSKAMPRAPLVTLPYGSAPATFDPATGLAPTKPPEETEGRDGDDTDADTDAGGSALARKEAAGA